MRYIFLTSALFVAFIMFQSAGCNNVKELDYKGIESTEIQSIGLNNSAIRVNLKYFNPNKFGIDVKETNLSLYLNDKFVGIADQPEKTQIPKQSDFIFPVVAHFDPLKIIGTAFKSLFSKTNKLSIQGTAKLGKSGVYIKVPINITENVSLMSK